MTTTAAVNETFAVIYEDGQVAVRVWFDEWHYTTGWLPAYDLVNYPDALQVCKHEAATWLASEAQRALRAAYRALGATELIAEANAAWQRSCDAWKDSLDVYPQAGVQIQLA